MVGNNQAAQEFTRQHTEVADSYGQSGQESMPQLIEFVEECESETLRPPHALGEHRFRSSVLHNPVEESYNVLWLIFAIPVHDDHGIEDCIMVQPCQPDSNSALVAYVAPEPQPRGL
jgi:hypothetical protein